MANKKIEKSATTTGRTTRRTLVFGSCFIVGPKECEKSFAVHTLIQLHT